MATFYKEEDIPDLKDRVIFFDANIIFSIYFTMNPNDWAQQNYSRVFSKLINAKNPLTLDVTIVSEVVNRALRMEYKTFLRKKTLTEDSFAYKKFRNSGAGRSAWLRIGEMMRDVIFPQFSVSKKSWAKDELDDLLIKQGDFNDQLITSLCIEKNYVLLTNDADFKDTDVEVLSLNEAFSAY